MPTSFVAVPVRRSISSRRRGSWKSLCRSFPFHNHLSFFVLCTALVNVYSCYFFSQLSLNHPLTLILRVPLFTFAVYLRFLPTTLCVCKYLLFSSSFLLKLILLVLMVVCWGFFSSNYYLVSVSFPFALPFFWFTRLLLVIALPILEVLLTSTTSEYQVLLRLHSHCVIFIYIFPFFVIS